MLKHIQSSVNSGPILRCWQDMEATDEIYFLVNMILPLTVFGTRPVTLIFLLAFLWKALNQSEGSALFGVCSLPISYPALSAQYPTRVCWLELNWPILFYLHSFNVIRAEFWQCESEHETETISFGIIATWLFQSLEDGGWALLIFASPVTKILPSAQWALT